MIKKRKEKKLTKKLWYSGAGKRCKRGGTMG